MTEFRVQGESSGTELGESSGLNEDAAKRAENEIEIYEQLSLHGNIKLLDWWNNVQHKIPHLYKLAITIFAIPASTSSVESSFSIAAQVNSPKRSRLSPELMEALLLKKYNKNVHKPVVPSSEETENSDDDDDGSYK